MRQPILLATILLAGCGGPSPAPEANVQADVQANAAVEPAAPDVAPTNSMPPFAEVENAHPTAPEPAPIPAAFRGIWAENAALCGDLSHPVRLVISGTTLRFHESVMNIARVDAIGPREANFIGTATGEGTTRPAEYHFSVDAAGRTLTDGGGGGMVRVRCGS